MVPKVSIIMPVYNTADSMILSQCINSILNQTYKEFELIICDDCSTDGTYEMLLDLLKGINHITLLRNTTNSGVSRTRNKCLEVAKGEYIALQDCDDWSDLTRLEKQVCFLDAHPEYSFASSNVCYYEETSYRISEYTQYPQKWDFLYTLPFCHAACMVRKNALATVGGYRIAPETILRAEDYDMFMRMYAAGMKGAVIPDCLYYYRINFNVKRKRRFLYNIHESIIRYKGFYALKLYPKAFFYVIKPIIAWFIPTWFLKKIQYKRFVHVTRSYKWHYI